MTFLTYRGRIAALASALVLFHPLVGCAGPASALTMVASVALEVTGLKKPDLPDSQKPPRLIKIRIHAAQNLNMDARGNGMAVIVRIYKLRGTTAFDQLNYAGLQDPRQEKEALGQDLVEVREIVLIPGQKYEIDEKVPYEVGFVGIAALFRAPANGRWKYAFQASSVEKSGMTLGAHACAFTVTAGDPIAVETDARLLSSTRCG